MTRKVYNKQTFNTVVDPNECLKLYKKDGSSLSTTKDENDFFNQMLIFKNQNKKLQEEILSLKEMIENSADLNRMNQLISTIQQLRNQNDRLQEENDKLKVENEEFEQQFESYKEEKLRKGKIIEDDDDLNAEERKELQHLREWMQTLSRADRNDIYNDRDCKQCFEDNKVLEEELEKYETKIALLTKQTDDIEEYQKTIDTLNEKLKNMDAVYQAAIETETNYRNHVIQENDNNHFLFSMLFYCHSVIMNNNIKDTVYKLRVKENFDIAMEKYANALEIITGKNDMKKREIYISLINDNVKQAYNGVSDSHILNEMTVRLHRKLKNDDVEIISDSQKILTLIKENETLKTKLQEQKSMPKNETETLIAFLNSQGQQNITEKNVSSAVKHLFAEFKMEIDALKIENKNLQENYTTHRNVTTKRDEILKDMVKLYEILADNITLLAEKKQNNTLENYVYNNVNELNDVIKTDIQHQKEKISTIENQIKQCELERQKTKIQLDMCTKKDDVMEKLFQCQDDVLKYKKLYDSLYVHISNSKHSNLLNEFTKTLTAEDKVYTFEQKIRYEIIKKIETQNDFFTLLNFLYLSCMYTYITFAFKNETETSIIENVKKIKQEIKAAYQDELLKIQFIPPELWNVNDMKTYRLIKQRYEREGKDTNEYQLQLLYDFFSCFKKPDIQ